MWCTRCLDTFYFCRIEISTDRLVDFNTGVGLSLLWCAVIFVFFSIWAGCELAVLSFAYYDCSVIANFSVFCTSSWFFRENCPSKEKYNQGDKDDWNNFKSPKFIYLFPLFHEKIRGRGYLRFSSYNFIKGNKQRKLWKN